ncbi:MAG: DUF357 domain-containing protein [Candidatus Pacearchaeota archaeon]
MEDVIDKVKVEKYFNITSKALNKARNSITIGKETEAEEIIEMAENYLSDAKHFENKGDLVNSFAALNYVHGWIDCGVRLGIFNVKDDKLFTLK